MSRRNLSKQQFDEPQVVHEARGFDQYLNLDDPKGNPLSSVHYNEHLKDVDIQMIRSHQEGKGHATKVLHELYNRHPDKLINWGKTSAPQSTHLAQKFSDQYGRTHFRPWMEGAIPGYEYGNYYGDKNPKEQK